MGQGQVDRQGREETKLRASMMLSKVFLQHLTSLASLPTFTALWLTILDLVGQFCASASTDILSDALPESLKNMLLVMDTSGRGLFFTADGKPTPLWAVTWEKVETFLPGLREELFPDWQNRSNPKPVSSENVQNQNAIPPPLDNSENTIPSEPKADAAPQADHQSGGESNVELATPSGSLPYSAPLLEAPTVVDQRDETGSIYTGEGEETTNVEGVGDEGSTVVEMVPIQDNPPKPLVEEDVAKEDTLTSVAVQGDEESSKTSELQGEVEQQQVGEVRAEESSTKKSHPQMIASLSTTLEKTILTSSTVTTQHLKERHPSLPGPSLLPPTSPSSPMEPPTLPFTAFSLPTSPSHTASTLTFSPITPAPSILHPPAPPLAAPRPLMAPAAPSPLPPLLPTSSSFNQAPSTAFSLPTLPPAPSNILPPSSPLKGEDGVETV